MRPQVEIGVPRSKMMLYDSIVPYHTSRSVSALQYKNILLLLLVSYCTIQCGTIWYNTSSILRVSYLSYNIES
jgi:hypothetical protein